MYTPIPGLICKTGKLIGLKRVQTIVIRPNFHILGALVPTPFANLAQIWRE